MKQVTGIVTKVGQQSLFNDNKYQWATVGPHNCNFVNRDMQQYAGQEITMTDVSEDQSKIQEKNDKNGKPFVKVFGSGVEITGAGQPLPTQQSAAPRQQIAQTRSDVTQEERLRYGLDCIEMAEGMYGNRDMPGELVAAIFNSSMYAFNDGVPLKAAPLEEKVAEVFGGTVEKPLSNEDLDDDQVPF